MPEKIKYRETVEEFISPEEKVLWKGRRNNKILNFYLILGLITTIAIAFFFLTYGSVEHHLGSSNITDGSAIASLAIFIGFIISFTIYYNKHASKYVLTDKKIIIQHGVLSQTINYAYYDSITRIYQTNRFIGSLFNVGTIYIDSGKKTSSKLKWREIRGKNMNPSAPRIIYYAIKDVENPKKLNNLIERLIEKNQQAKPHEGVGAKVKELEKSGQITYEEK